MRMLLAVIFLLAWWGVLIGVTSSAFPRELPVWAGTIVVIGVMVPIPIALVLFNKYPWATLRRLTTDQLIAELEAKGQLDREPHVAGRVMGFEDPGPSSQVFLIESVGKGTLMLHGQYLYSYGPGDPDDVDEGEQAEPRTFPTQRFELLRKRGDADILDIARHGAVIEPEDVPAPVDALYRQIMKWPMDGTLITDPSYDALRDRLLRGI